MPRAPSTDPQRQRHQQRQRRYRSRLRETGQPEADAVDAALAAAIVGVATDERAAEQQDAVLKGYLSALLKRARRELVDRGYERERATAALQRRLTLVYEDGVSMHVTLFGLDGQRAIICQDGKGFYGRVFSDNEARWNGSGATYDKSLATEVFGQSDTGYIEQIRDQNHRSLSQAIFGPSGNIGTRTIVQRIADVQTDLDNFADAVEQTVGGLSDDFDAFQQSVNAQLTDILSRLSAIETRLDNGGL